jgi:hypothetical protein
MIEKGKDSNVSNCEDQPRMVKGELASLTVSDISGIYLAGFDTNRMNLSGSANGTIGLPSSGTN